MTNFVHKLTETVVFIWIPKSIRVDKSVGTMRAAIADRLRFVATGETLAINFNSQPDVLVFPFGKLSMNDLYFSISGSFAFS